MKTFRGLCRNASLLPNSHFLARDLGRHYQVVTQGMNLKTDLNKAFII